MDDYDGADSGFGVLQLAAALRASPCQGEGVKKFGMCHPERSEGSLQLFVNRVNHK
jgi:hypothetical protein